MNDKERAKKVLSKLAKAYPDAPVTYLDFKSPFEMLIATILSARAMDVTVNKVTSVLFKKYPDAKSMMGAPLEDLATIIRTVGAHNRKAEYLKNSASMIVEEFNGKIPKTIDELARFPGVSRKTANVVLQVAFGINEGVIVDTHIGRVSEKLGLSESKTPEKIERDLMELLPQKSWSEYARLIGAHGRRTCKSRKPNCPTCAVNDLCPSAEL